ncbi:MAG: FkbM family methyltransferase [Planctomycetota bacterium]
MSTKKGPIHSLGGHLRDAFISVFPVEMKTPRGLTVFLRNRSEMSVFHDTFVRRVYPFDAIRPRLAGIPAPIVFDVGANSGLFTAAVMDLWPGAVIHAFEPQPPQAKRVAEFARLNHLAERITVNAAAAGGQAGVREFYANRNPISSSLIREKAARRRIHRTWKVPVMRLDDYATEKKLPRVDMLKVDVEGSEYEVLDGAARIVASARVILLEVHPPYSRFGEAARRLAPMGFRCIAPLPPPTDEDQITVAFVR